VHRQKVWLLHKRLWLSDGRHSGTRNSFFNCNILINYPKMQTTIDESESVKKFINKTITNRRRAIKKKDTGCQTTNLLVKPLRLRNIDRDWLVIVQDTNDIFQREEIAICSHPNVPCRHNISSRSAYCHQKYSTRKLLAFDPCNPVRGVYVESFKLQSACDCRL
jgi:hypothetical protein